MVLATSSKGNPDFYIGSWLNISCVASGFIDIEELELRGNFDKHLRAGCMRSGRGPITGGPGYTFAASRSVLLEKLGFSVYENSNCTFLASGNPSGYTISTSAVITAEMDGVGLHCEAYDGSATSSVRSGHDIILTQLKGNR